MWDKTFYLGAVFRHRKKVKLYGREVHLVGSYGVLNPAHGVADLGAHARLALQSAAVAQETMPCSCSLQTMGPPESP